MPYTHDQLADMEAIRDATKRYCRGVDRLDPDEMKKAYWPDGTDDHGVFVGNAYEFVDMCMESHLGWRSTMHCIFNHLIELDDDGIHAKGEVYNVTYLYRADNGALEVWNGRYLDEYEKRGDEWRILHRVCVHEGTTSASLPPMEIDSSNFRKGDFDRPAQGRRIGP